VMYALIILLILNISFYTWSIIKAIHIVRESKKDRLLLRGMDQCRETSTK
jgi:hypothetical protein